MRRVDVIMPGLLAAFGAVILWQSATRMDYFNYDRGAPGPGFLPFWVSLGVTALGLVLAIQAARSPASGPADGEWPDALGRRRIVFVLGSFVLFLLLLRILGFVLSSALFLSAVGYFLGMRKLWILLPVSIVFAVMLHIMFAVWLRISLPLGVVGEHARELLPWIF